MQEAFIRAYDSLATCRDPSRFKAWFFRILTNQCHNARDRRRRHAPLDDTVPGGSATDRRAEQADLSRLVAAALEKLTEEQRTAFVMKHIDERSYQEMAELLGEGVDALKMRVYRARDAIRKELEQVL